MPSWTAEQIEQQLRALGVRDGAVLLVHTSFRKVGPVEGGPLALIEALKGALGPKGTLVMPTMTDGETVFDPATTPTHRMGITAELFFRQPDVVRSPHPGASFAAMGPLAARICAPHPLAPPHGLDSPAGRVYGLGGQVLLLGVEHSESTVMHVAESLAKVPYSVEHPCVVEVDGVAESVMIAETDHCSRRFRQLDAWLDASRLQRTGPVGNSTAKLVEARDPVRVALERLTVDPLVFLCDPAEFCGECAAARASIHDASGIQ
jgi:aminoglycoside 3-N-acetyltransferase